MNRTGSPSHGVKIDYSPLDEGQYEIRLITIFPNTAPSSLVRCTLETVSLKSVTVEYQLFVTRASTNQRKGVIDWRKTHSTSSLSPENIPSSQNYRFAWGDYAALSYVWGNPHDTKAIIINDKEIQVGANLEVALRVLSSQSDFQDRYKLWVDAICINQKDCLERSRQIQKMKNIYGHAWAVIAWLGEERDNSDKAIDLVRDLSNARSENCGEMLEERLREDPGYLGYGCWMALNDFMCRQYWFRLWIIQEVVLGSSSLVLRCGTRTIDWNSFCNGIGFLFDYLWTVKDHLLVWEVHQNGQQDVRSRTWTTASLHLVYRDLWAMSQLEEQGVDKALSFGRLLNIANLAESQDIRDKVYGLVGMIDPAIARKIVPDYTLPPAIVYAAVAKLFISIYGNLEPIREGNPWGNARPPSWAADWTWAGRNRHSRLETLPWGPYWTQKGRPPIFQLAKLYNASGDMSMKATFSDDDLHLTCRGFVIDEIDGLTAREADFFSWVEDSIIQPQSDKNAYGDGIIEALYRTLLADRVAGGQKASERHEAILNLPTPFKIAEEQFKKLGWIWLSKQGSYYFRLSRWRFANRSFQLMGRPLCSYFTDRIPDGASEYDYTEVYSCADRTCKGRRFMTTANGYLGWAPDNMNGNDEDQVRKGDKVAIIFGCSTPITVRPQGSYYQVLGETYVHEMMDGEALELLKTGRFESQDFEFR